MKEATFKYQKKGTEEVKEYSVVIIKENKETIEGISIGTFTPEDQKRVRDIVADFEEKLEPFMDQYRRFNKESILKEEI